MIGSWMLTQESELVMTLILKKMCARSIPAKISQKSQRK